jgi:glyoxylase-like metal-dependent hydrolase (beta-lactamase superfamily II)
MIALKHALHRLPLAALALAGLWLAWSQAQQPAQLELQKVTENLYVIIGSGGNVAFMPTSEGVVVVDDKFAQDAPQIMAKIKSVTDKPVRYVLNTHQHGDHTGGNDAMLAANAEILMHKNARANMVKGKQPGLSRITYGDETQVFLGGKEVQAHHLGRGHTNGDAFIYFRSERVLHTGDLFVAGAPFVDTANGGSIKEWDQTVQKALAYDFDKVIPGHGPVSAKADLQKWVQTVAAVREHVRKACTGGPAADAVKRLDLSDIGLKTGGIFDRGVPGMCEELAR